MLSQKTLIRLAPWLVILFLGLLWELLVVGLGVPEFLFPSVSAVWTSTLTHWDPIMMHATQTFLTTLAGFGLAVGVGLVLGAVIGSSPVIYKALYPLLVGFNSIPKVAFVPGGTSGTIRNEPISGAKTNGTWPSRLFLSRVRASITAAGSTSSPLTGSPTALNRWS